MMGICNGPHLGAFKPQFLNGWVFSQLQGDLAIMFSDGLRVNVYDREVVLSVFVGYGQSLVERKNGEKPLIVMEKHDQCSGPDELNKLLLYNYIKWVALVRVAVGRTRAIYCCSCAWARAIKRCCFDGTEIFAVFPEEAGA